MVNKLIELIRPCNYGMLFGVCGGVYNRIIVYVMNDKIALIIIAFAPQIYANLTF